MWSPFWAGSSATKRLSPRRRHGRAASPSRRNMAWLPVRLEGDDQVRLGTGARPLEAPVRFDVERPGLRPSRGPGPRRPRSSPAPGWVDHLQARGLGPVAAEVHPRHRGCVLPLPGLARAWSALFLGGRSSRSDSVGAGSRPTSSRRWPTRSQAERPRRPWMTQQARWRSSSSGACTVIGSSLHHHRGLPAAPRARRCPGRC